MKQIGGFIAANLNTSREETYRQFINARNYRTYREIIVSTVSLSSQLKFLAFQPHILENDNRMCLIRNALTAIAVRGGACDG